MRAYIKELKPTCIEDLMAMVALYRPGPMESIPQFIKAKHGEIQIKYLHPLLEPLLRESYGVIVYQDQVLLIAVQLAGFTWGEVDKFRKAMSKKIREELVKYREKFIAGCAKNDIDQKVAREIFTFIEPFGGYGFNKSHACAYASVAYQTAYLKANYTAEFMAATLTTEASDAKKVIAAVEECQRMGVPVLPPDSNRSDSGFSVERVQSEEEGAVGWGVRFGLVAIKNVGTRPIDEILESRRRDGPFTSLVDLFARTDSKNLTRGAAECLIKAGALDQFGKRSQLLQNLDRALALGQQQRKMREIGQNSLFGGASGTSFDEFSLADGPEYPQQQLLAWEKELLNLYLSAHPLAHVASILKRRVSVYTTDLSEEWAGQKVVLGGRVTEVRRITTKKGDLMAAVQLEDMRGSIEVVVFPKAYQVHGTHLHEDAILLVTGTVKLRDEEPQLVCESVEEFIPTDEELNHREYLLRIRVTRTAENDVLELARMDQLLTVLMKYPGEDRFELIVRNGKWEAKLIPGKELPGIKFCPELMQRLEEILGPNTVDPLIVSPPDAPTATL
jgi:DNA polymerase-3 subunit alpha